MSTLQPALFQWEDGFRRLKGLGEDPGAARRATRLVAAVQDELRRRLGPDFSAAGLADLYAQGTDWCRQAAFEAGGPDAFLWDEETVVDAAFFLTLREAADYAGGRLVERGEESG